MLLRDILGIGMNNYIDTVAIASQFLGASI